MPKLDEQINANYIDLAAAIIKRAIYDYKRALKTHDKREIVSLEKFFNSEYCESLSLGNKALIWERVSKLKKRYGGKS